MQGFCRYNTIRVFQSLRTWDILNESGTDGVEYCKKVAGNIKSLVNNKSFTT